MAKVTPVIVDGNKKREYDNKSDFIAGVDQTGRYIVPDGAEYVVQEEYQVTNRDQMIVEGDLFVEGQLFMEV